MSISTTDLKVGDVLLKPDEIPVVGPKTFLKEALADMSRHKLGIVCITDDAGRLLGIFTDGDLRRMLLKDQKPLAALFADDVIDHAAKTPLTTSPDDSLESAIRLMDEKRVWDLPVTGEQNLLMGLLHLHPAIKTLMGA